MHKIEIIQPDDFHIHLRDKNKLLLTVPHASRSFGRVLVMPNLIPPIETIQQVNNYSQAINTILNNHNISNQDFSLLYSLYITKNTSKLTIQEAKKHPLILGFKLYPLGATTNSSYGIKNIESIYFLLEEMEKIEVPLMIHGEVVDQDIDIFDREKVFIDRILSVIHRKFPRLVITLEHITTKEAVDFVKETSRFLKASVTVHHLYLNRNDLLVGGIKPHHYCLPIVKREEDKKALIEAVISGNENFFLGTDSAPHGLSDKENSCGCAGIYTSPVALELYTEIFYQMKAMNKLEAFTSKNGAKHYKLPLNSKKIQLIRQEQKIPKSYLFDKELLIPFKAEETIFWKIEKNH